ncbi:hypothetical protein [Xylanimonas protaetiae]|uniref:Uncharacterized protein n=1 Tax=Xylanimonas protaetiae TaxID=2509457 RepID=A0A4V0YG56_9MICO|nr:hypothetical protein [Xylanimonas protaetiae]QAY70041.1 hypothetical protein ET471_08330 [Xylanimonas protaetiae]
MAVTGTEVKKALALRHEVDAMLADPDLTGDLLLVALILVALLHDPARKRGVSWRQIAERAGMDVNQRLRFIIARDVPRYEPPNGNGCTAAMIRRDGPCGKRTHASGYTIDPLTGVRTPWGRCTRHYSIPDERARAATFQAWEANGRPEPPANAGGILPRYFDTDWMAVWAWAAPYRKPLPDGKPPTPPKPVLRLIRGGAA